MSQAAYAQAVGVSKTTVKNWEAGDSFPEMGRLPDLARPLNIVASSLFRLPDSPPESIHEAFLKVRNARIALEEAEEHLGRLLGKQNNNTADSQESAVLGGDL